MSQNFFHIFFPHKCCPRTYDKPFLTLFGEDDPITRGAEKHLIERIAGAAGQPHRTLGTCGHFCQEDQPDVLAQGVIAMARKAGHLG